MIKVPRSVIRNHSIIHGAQAFWRSAALRLFLTFILTLFGYQYFQTKIYHLPEPTPLSGAFLYNPYANIKGRGLKSNFHVHSHSWLGLTNGKQSGEEILEAYKRLDYDVISISDYHKINPAIYQPDNIAIPAYEHGMNLFKRHYLSIGAEKVSYFDVMLWQNDHIKQFMIEQMNLQSQVVCMAHPGLRSGHSEAAIGKLTGYQCMEVINRGRNYARYWDAALSAGRPVWIMANDDCHDLIKDDYAQSWNLIFGDQPIESLRTGRMVAVQRKVTFQHPDSLQQWVQVHRGDILKSVTVTDSMVSWRLNQPVNTIRLIGQSGKLKSEASDTDHIEYLFRSEDTYIRAEIDAGGLMVYLNPVIRYEGRLTPANSNQAAINFEATLLLRVSILLAFLVAIMALFPSTRKLILYGRIDSIPNYEQAIT